MKKALFAVVMTLGLMSQAHATSMPVCTENGGCFPAGQAEAMGTGKALGLGVLLWGFGEVAASHTEWQKANPETVAKQFKEATYNCGQGNNWEMTEHQATIDKCSYIGPVLDF